MSLVFFPLVFSCLFVFFVLFFGLLACLLEEAEKQEGMGRGRAGLLVRSPSACNTQAWARLKPVTRTSVQVSLWVARKRLYHHRLHPQNMHQQKAEIKK